MPVAERATEKVSASGNYQILATPPLYLHVSEVSKASSRITKQIGQRRGDIHLRLGRVAELTLMRKRPLNPITPRRFPLIQRRIRLLKKLIETLHTIKRA